MKEECQHTFAICAYRESRFLEECILSLKSQTVKSNIIMVTSTPNEYIECLAQKYEIPLYVNDNGGITQDWNFAYRNSKSKYVTIAHQDDVYFSQYTEKILEYMNKANDPIICFTDYCEIRNGKKISTNNLLKIKRAMLFPLKFSWSYNKKKIRRLVLGFGCPICCPSVTFMKKKIIQAPFRAGFRSDEDWEAWERLSKLSGEYIYIPKKLMGHRIHEESETSNILADNARKEEDYVMFCKFWPSWIAKVLTRLYSNSEKSNKL